MKIKNKTISIENSNYNIDEIDFILLNGKIRIYRSNGDVDAILGGYSQDERKDNFYDLVHSLTNIKEHNFVSLKGGKLININNVVSSTFNNGNVLLKTKGFTLQIDALTDAEIRLLSDVLYGEIKSQVLV